jgi:phosphoribosylformylglycinamidine synthase subunit PurS
VAISGSVQASHWSINRRRRRGLVTRPDDNGARTWIAEVIVVPKPGVNDPQGEAIRGGLHSLGYSGVDSVRSGRFFRLSLHAPDEASARAEAVSMSERLLANPVIETFSLTVEPGDDPSRGGGD